jgi:DNA-binding CsgD family transcriptional regulator
MSQHINGTNSERKVPIDTSLGGPLKYAEGGKEMALLALSHTPVEHAIYAAMLKDVNASVIRIGEFGVRRLMELTGLRSYSSVRRGIAGLLSKRSIAPVEHEKLRKVSYYIFEPEEIFSRRSCSGQSPYPDELREFEVSRLFPLIVEAVTRRDDLSRREAIVTLLCAEGRSNAQIGRKLHIDEKTVKYHLRHIYAKFGLRRRSELVSFLLGSREPSNIRSSADHDLTQL